MEFGEVLLFIAAGLGVLVVVALVIGAGVRSGMRSADNTPNNDGPGVYWVTGVDKSTGEDAGFYVDAASAANAKIKAELGGMIVASMKRASGTVAKAVRKGASPGGPV